MQLVLMAPLLFVVSAKVVVVAPLMTRGKVDKTTATKLDRELATAFDHQPGIQVVNDKQTRAALEKCAQNAACLGSAARKAKADRAVLAILNGGRPVDLLLISATDGAVVYRLSFKLSRSSDFKKVASDHASKLLMGDVSDMPALQAIAPLKKKDPEPTNNPASVVSLASPASAPMVEAQRGKPTVKPADSRPVESAFARAPSEQKPPRVFLWTGASVAALGVVSVCVGAYFGLNAQNTANQVISANPSQLDVNRLETQANTSARSANVAFGIGFPVIAVGAALVGLDFYLNSKTKSRVSLGPSGTALQWSTAW
jgi:hypothetical protein